MSEVEKITKELYGSKFHPTSGKMKVFDVATRGYKDVPETGVFGRFVKVRQLDAFKSNQSGKPVYYESVICLIKVNNPTSKDVVAEAVNSESKTSLIARFPKAWEEFLALEKEHKSSKADAGEENEAGEREEGAALDMDALKAKAEKLGIKNLHFYKKPESLAAKIAEVEGK